MIKSNDFIARAVWIAQKLNTVYALGMWGWQISPETVKRKATQLPKFYTPGKISYLNGLKGYWGFDCVCLVKSILWGFGSNLSDIYGGAKYASNGVPDFGADSIGEYCTLYTTDFSLIVPGAVLHCPGHVGIYIGDGLAVECTARWSGKVLITAVGNIGAKRGYYSRMWTEWGKLRFIDYDEKGGDDIKEMDALEKRVAALEKPLKVYHFWSEIEKDLPWAYKPLKTMYDAHMFSGDSAKDLNITLDEIKALVVVANLARRLGIITY